ncbi:uncharacterized protein V1510DRAFT_359564 [Dipodascopsis tothii]|uniref:uncharacterized protein n=1 Tax=Dipodascopsis tothii TaxID=44089 RepID=UPI0034CF7CAE
MLMSDTSFRPFSFEELRQIIGANRLELLGRRPSDLRRYLAWKAKTVAEHGSVAEFIRKERLAWPATPPEGAAYLDSRGEWPRSALTAADVRILLNDFAYGVAEGIVHVVVWSRHRIPLEDAPAGQAVVDISAAARARIDAYVAETFTRPLGLRPEQVLWFKNWAQLQSVGALEHFHVLLDRPAASQALVDVVRDDTDVVAKLRALGFAVPAGVS